MSAYRRIGKLYEIEEEIRGRLPEARASVRRDRAKPLLDDLKAWLEAQLARVSKKSELAVAIRYALSLWVALTRYRDDGRLEIDNNAADGRCAPWHSGARTTSSPDRTPVARTPPRSTA